MFSAQSLIKFSSKKNQSGQGIIEIVVVLGLAAILILSLVALSVRSNRSANFSKAEDQAARLSQEGMEFVRSMRDRNPPTDPIRDITNNPQPWGWVFEQDFSGSVEANFCGTVCLSFDSTYDEPLIDVGGRTFTRQVLVEDDAINPDDPATPFVETIQLSCNIFPATTDWEDVKQFTVEVVWTDTTGSHTSTTNSCLRK